MVHPGLITTQKIKELVTQGIYHKVHSLLPMSPFSFSKDHDQTHYGIFMVLFVALITSGGCNAKPSSFLNNGQI